MRAVCDDAILLVVDIQANFMSAIDRADEVRRRSKFLIQVANLLEVPIYATEQNPERMGTTDPELLELIGRPAFSKMAFSAWGSEELQAALTETGRAQVVLVGIETHICVTQTALDLIPEDFAVFVAADAVSARTADRHLLGLERLRDSGVTVAHSESIVYEWMSGADHERFRDVLSVVKSSA